MQSFEAKSKQGRVAHSVGGIRGPRTSGQQLRPRKSSGGPRQSKGQTPESNAQVPTAPLQLDWFPGNQVLHADGNKHGVQRQFRLLGR